MEKTNRKYMISVKNTERSSQNVRQRENVRAFLRQKQKKQAISY